MYDLAADPDCVHNLAGVADRQSVKTALAQQLGKDLLAEGDLRMLGRGAEYEAQPYSDQRWRGFYEQFQAGKVKPGWVNPGDFEEGGDSLSPRLPKE